MVDLDVSYALTQSEAFDFELVAGWHFLRHDFSRSDFAFEVLSISFSQNISPVSEEVDANGLKLGVRLKGNFSPQYKFDGYFSWNILSDVKAKNSVLGTIDSEGNSIRWGILLGCSLSEMSILGCGTGELSSTWMKAQARLQFSRKTKLLCSRFSQQSEFVLEV